MKYLVVPAILLFTWSHIFSQSCMYMEYKVGTNLVPLIAGGNPEISLDLKPRRFLELSMLTGWAFRAGKENDFMQVPIKNYDVSGSFIKLGLKNYLINNFRYSRFDIFTGLYYIASFADESHLDADAKKISGFDFVNAVAIQSGITFRLRYRISMDVGMQYTFYSSGSGNSTEIYQPGIGKMNNGSAWQGIFCIKYVFPIFIYSAPPIFHKGTLFL